MGPKLVCYEKDPNDRAAIIRLGFCAAQHPLDGRRPRAVDLGSFLADGIWRLQYQPPPQKAQLRQCIQEAIARAFPPSHTART